MLAGRHAVANSYKSIVRNIGRVLFWKWRCETIAKQSTKTKAARGPATKRGKRASKAASGISIHADLSHYKIGEATTATRR